MVITLMNSEFVTIAVIEDYESFIWTDRYNKYGDFEYYGIVTKEKLELFQPGYYLVNDLSEHTMIIEGIDIISNVEDGDKIKVTGRSLESILDRRIVWNQTILSGKLQNGILALIDAAFVNPKLTERKIDNFDYNISTDLRVTSLTIDSQYTGDNIYEIIEDNCEDKKMGFRVLKNENNQFVFELYFGTDRSDKQTDSTPVIFSNDYDNVISMDYIESTATLKNVTLVAGEGEGSARKTTTYGEGSGLLRRELFTDARDLSTKTSTATLTDAVYYSQLKQRGKEKLAENKTTMDFEGEVDATGLFKFGVDFFLGDYVTFKDQFGTNRRVRVDEMIFNESSEGYKYYPKFTVEDPDELEEPIV